MNKEHILSEIKRTADENGGAPLGLKSNEPLMKTVEHRLDVVDLRRTQE